MKKLSNTLILLIAAALITGPATAHQRSRADTSTKSTPVKAPTRPPLPEPPPPPPMPPRP
ncbi:MAG: hypothetical protein V4649_05690 [Bacteroidota bacterium]